MKLAPAQSKVQFMKTMLMAIASIAVLVWVGTLVLNWLEPIPEYGGPAHDWAADIRAVIRTLSLVIAWLLLTRHQKPLLIIGCKLHARETLESLSLPRVEVPWTDRLFMLVLVYMLAHYTSACCIWNRGIFGGVDCL